MHSLHADGLVLNLLQRPDLGGEDWWRQVAELGTPLVESLPAAQVRVTFFGATRGVMNGARRLKRCMSISTA